MAPSPKPRWGGRPAISSAVAEATRAGRCCCAGSFWLLLATCGGSLGGQIGNACPPVIYIIGILSSRGGTAMPKRLSNSALEAYRHDGFYFPVPVLSPTEVVHFRSCLEEHEAKVGEPLQGNFRHKAHLLFTWVD